MSHVAFTDRDGVISFGPKCPANMLPIARSDDLEPLKATVSALARRAGDNTTLLVPGVPEAATDDAAVDAVFVFGKNVRSRLQETSR